MILATCYLTLATAPSTDDIPVVDRAADQRAGTAADDGAEHLRSAGGDDVAEHGARHATDDQACRAVVALAVVTVI